jgi:hypothetical protein
MAASGPSAVALVAQDAEGAGGITEATGVIGRGQPVHEERPQGLVLAIAG